MNFHAETLQTIAGLAARNPNTVSVHENKQAVRNGHPLLVTLDAMLRAAHDHENRHGVKMADDYFTGPLWLKCATAARDMLSADLGPFDNGTGEEIFWRAMSAAGFTESDI